MRFQIALTLLLAAAPVSADLRFTALTPTEFVVHDQGGNVAKATKALYSDAASICVAAGFEFMLVVQQGTEQSGAMAIPNGKSFVVATGQVATARIRLLETEGVGAIACGPLSKPKKVEAAKRKLAKKLRKFREP